VFQHDEDYGKKPVVNYRTAFELLLCCTHMYNPYITLYCHASYLTCTILITISTCKVVCAYAVIHYKRIQYTKPYYSRQGLTTLPFRNHAQTLATGLSLDLTTNAVPHSILPWKHYDNMPCTNHWHAHTAHTYSRNTFL